MAQPAPLMPKATAVWLVENTALSFDQIAEFCKLHPLEVKAIADGDAAQGIKGLDPIQTGQLTPRGDREGRSRPGLPAQAPRPEGAAAGRQAQEGPALHAGVAPPGPAERDPLAGAQPSGAQGRADHAAGRHHQVDDPVDPRAHPLERRRPAADGPGDARPVLADRSRPRGAPRRQGKAGRRRRAGRDAAAGLRDHGARSASRKSRAEKKPGDELDVDAVFAKLKQIGGGKSDEIAERRARVARAAGSRRPLHFRRSSASTLKRPPAVTNSKIWPPIIETFFQNWVCCAR